MIEKIIDFYFRKPILIDFCLSILVGIGMCKLKILAVHSFEEEKVKDLSSDICGVCLTAAGFILTILTLIVTFKNSDYATKSKFYDSPYYFQTTKHLKNGVKVLIGISFLGYVLLNFYFDNSQYLKYFNTLSIVLVFLTLWRCLLILSKIIRMQS